jgi:hypothetical protein
MATYAMRIQPTNTVLEDRIFNSAKRVAFHLGSEVMYSGYHPWEYMNKFHTVEEASTDCIWSGDVIPSIWLGCYPFAHCLGMAYWFTRRLQKLLEGKPELAKYAPNVQLSAFIDGPDPHSETQFHAVTVVHFKTHCIFIDLVNWHVPVKVRLGEVSSTDYSKLKYLNYNGKRYVEETQNGRTPLTYHQIDAKVALQKLAFPASRNKPNTRFIFGRTVFDYEPDHMASTRFTRDDKDVYLANSYTVSIDFRNLVIGLEISQTWLSRRENADLVKRMKTTRLTKNMCLDESAHRMHADEKDWIQFSLSVAAYPFDTPAGHRMMKKLQLLDAIASRLGLLEDEIERIAKALVEWISDNEALIKANKKAGHANKESSESSSASSTSPEEETDEDCVPSSSASSVCEEEFDEDYNTSSSASSASCDDEAYSE